ncbi:aminodeoxychorismate synthase component I [Tomitella fengzijianii]|uniref:Aminodeoxychorismate synthase component I n=1 Tax=Tomitella fengzijianii TaxID=2597660 RepID=A0A516X1X1_9ACTN|nr:aminodeoxychorismate synthase component I [Tomitella fengzijianii]QDQ97053.1 aminodeoxychorismate synthase component I [Tomitella fengzijianii]
MLQQRLGPGASASAVLRGLGTRSAHRYTAGPAALTGRWFGAAAVIAPECRALPVEPRHAFTAPADHAAAPSRRAHARGHRAIGGGWIGYLSYPDGTRTATGHGRLPAAAGAWTDSVLVLDDAGCWWWESLTGETCPRDIAALVDPAGGGHSADPADGPRSAARTGPALHWSVDWTGPDPAQHRRGVEACLAAIGAGEIYQACVCTAFTGRYAGSPLGFFADATAATTPRRAAYIDGPGGAVASLSPETFLTRDGDRVESSPIKGTAPSTSPPGALRRSVKDVAENIMIVDLVRNDLGRVAAVGSVRARRLLEVRRAPGVWHLVSTVSATLPTGTADAGLIAATFPPASVTGTPKARARDLLDGWEGVPRGVYCGTVGMFSPVAGLELNVAIRTVEFRHDGSAVLGVGGGITSDSDPAAEWQECLDKAASIIGLVPSSRADGSGAVTPAPREQPGRAPSWTVPPHHPPARRRP